MKLWLILGGVTAGVVLMFGALRAKSPAASTPTWQRVSEIQPSSEEHEAASRNLSAPNEFSPGVVPSDESSISATATLLEGLPEGDQQRDLARELLTKLFENDPASAAELVAALHEPLQMQMAAALASLWGEKDPQSAAEWVKKLPSSPARTHALLSLCGDWAALDPQSAANFVINAPVSDFPTGSATSTESTMTNAPGTDVRSQMLFIIGNHWAAKASGEAIISVSQTPDGANRDSLIAGIASTLAESSPSDAATLVASITPGRQQNDAALTVLLEWGRSDPAAAANWLKLFPSGEFRDKAIQSLTATLAQREPDSANSVLLDWPVTDERTSAIRYYLNETLDTDASRGVSVLAGIQDGPLFQEETERVAQHWLMQQPSVALEWLGETDLEDSTKMRLLSAPGLAVPSPF
jgi:hypothetical protein